MVGKRREDITKELLKELYWGQQMTVYEISKALRCSSSTVHEKMRLYGIKVRGRPGVEKFNLMSDEEFRELYDKQGYSISRVAKVIGCSETPVRKRVAALGIRPGHMRRRWRLSIAEDELRELYEDQGLSIKSIAKKYDCDESTIRRRMRAFGIRVRTRSEESLLRLGLSLRALHSFSGDLQEKAYLIGFSGDLCAGKEHAGSQLMFVQCSSTRAEQIKLFRQLFQNYGYIHASHAHGRGNEINIRCYLDESFEFLLKREDRVDTWIMEDDDCFAAFLAGYVDAEGNIYVSHARGEVPQAAFRLVTCDKNILHQCHQKFASLGIVCPSPKLAVKGGMINKYGVISRRDLWRLGVHRKSSLLQLFNLIDPYLKHEKRRRDMERARENIRWRNRKFGNRGMN